MAIPVVWYQTSVGNGASAFTVSHSSTVVSVQRCSWVGGRLDGTVQVYYNVIDRIVMQVLPANVLLVYYVWSGTAYGGSLTVDMGYSDSR